MSTISQDRGLRLLSLDGGGIRGVSELVILDELMSRLQQTLDLPELPRPYQYFDIIGGTSTGGLISIMLGRLRMSTTEALTEYNQLARYIFGDKKWAFQDGAFKATRLEKAIKEIVERYAGDDNSDMLDLRGDSVCKIFVCAVTAHQIDTPTLFRSYSVPAGISCQIWQAARATSAAPTFFKRITIGRENEEMDYIDGGIVCNNPAQQVLDEARRIHKSRRVDCILSVGTGRAQTVGLPQPNAFQKLLPTDIVTVLKKLATDSERTARELENRYRDTPGVYFRLNVELGLQNITLEEWTRMTEVTEHTIKYLKDDEVSQEVDNLVNILAGISVPRSSATTVTALIAPISRLREGTLKHFTVPYCPSSAFTGREDILRLLENRFLATHSEVSGRIFVLYGLGGSGKTQICLKFCEQFRERFWGVFWIDATSDDTAEEGFKEIAQLLQIDETQVAVKQYLSISEEQWLLIFDNADNPDIDISQHFPLGGNILITSRNPNYCRYAPGNDSHFDADTMKTEEAMDLLLKVACIDVSDDARCDAKQLVDDLGCLALAIDQAGSYIATRKCTINEYQLKFQNSRDRSKLLGEQLSGQRPGSYQSTVYTTWEISMQMVQDTNVLASDILQLFSYLHYAQIPREIFERASDRVYDDILDYEPVDMQWSMSRVSPKIYELLCARKGDNKEVWDEDIFEQAIDTLQSFSLIKRERYESNPIYILHRLVSSWTRERFPDAEQYPYNQAVVCILNRSIQSTFAHSDTDLRFLRRLFVHVEACREHFSEYFVCNPAMELDVLWEMANFALVCTQSGSWKKAEELEVQVMEMRKRVLGREHPDTLISMSNLASTYRNQGLWNEAEELEVQVMEMSSRVLSQEHPDTLTSMDNLASTYSSQGRWNEAEKLFLQVIDARKRVLRQDYPSTLTSMGGLASTYMHQGRWKEAEELEVQVMETRKRVLSQEHPDTLTSTANLASALWNQGRWKEAEELEVQVMETRKRVLGQEHPDTLISMGNLALTYRNQGWWKMAEELEVQVMETSSKILSQEHPDTLTSMDNLASTYMYQGRWKEAQNLELQVMHTRKRVLGQEHPSTWISMSNLASTYRNQGLWNQAEELEVQVMETRKGVLGLEHPSTLISMSNLASTYRKQGRLKEAEEMFLQVMDMRKRVLGQEHPDTLISMANIALTYMSQNRWKEAEALEVLVVEMSSRVLGQEHPDTLLAMHNLAYTYQSQDRIDEAIKMMSTAADLQSRILGAEHPNTKSSVEALLKWRDRRDCLRN